MSTPLPFFYREVVNLPPLQRQGPDELMRMLDLAAMLLLLVSPLLLYPSL